MVGGISGWQLMILLLIVVLVFGTKRLRNIGSDLGSAVKGFRKGMEEDPNAQTGEEDSQKLVAEDESVAAGQASEDNEPASRPPGTDV